MYLAQKELQAGNKGTNTDFFVKIYKFMSIWVRFAHVDTTMYIDAD